MSTDTVEQKIVITKTVRELCNATYKSINRQRLYYICAKKDKNCCGYLQYVRELIKQAENNKQVDTSLLEEVVDVGDYPDAKALGLYYLANKDRLDTIVKSQQTKK